MILIYTPFDKEIIEDDDLAVPHPWMCDRSFVLDPLCEIAPNVVHPLGEKHFNLKRARCKPKMKENKYYELNKKSCSKLFQV